MPFVMLKVRVKDAERVVAMFHPDYVHTEEVCELEYANVSAGGRMMAKTLVEAGIPFEMNFEGCVGEWSPGVEFFDGLFNDMCPTDMMGNPALVVGPRMRISMEMVEDFHGKMELLRNTRKVLCAA